METGCGRKGVLGKQHMLRERKVGVLLMREAWPVVEEWPTLQYGAQQHTAPTNTD